MCICLPSASEQRPSGKSRPLGPIKLFLAGLAFLAVMGLAAIESLWRARRTG